MWHAGQAWSDLAFCTCSLHSSIRIFSSTSFRSVSCLERIWSSLTLVLSCWRCYPVLLVPGLIKPSHWTSRTLAIWTGAWWVNSGTHRASLTTVHTFTDPHAHQLHIRAALRTEGVSDNAAIPGSFQPWNGVFITASSLETQRPDASPAHTGVYSLPMLACVSTSHSIILWLSHRVVLGNPAV